MKNDTQSTIVPFDHKRLPKPRPDAPPVEIGAPGGGSSSKIANKMVNEMNKFLKRKYPGAGFYATDIVAEERDPSRHHYMLYADDIFYNAFTDDFEYTAVQTAV